MGALMLCLFPSDCITQASSHTKEYIVLAFSQFFSEGETYCYAKVLGGGVGSSFKEVSSASPCWRKPAVLLLLPTTTA